VLGHPCNRAVPWLARGDSFFYNLQPIGAVLEWRNAGLEDLIG